MQLQQQRQHQDAAAGGDSDEYDPNVMMVVAGAAGGNARVIAGAKAISLASSPQRFVTGEGVGGHSPMQGATMATQRHRELFHSRSAPALRGGKTKSQCEGRDRQPVATAAAAASLSLMKARKGESATAPDHRTALRFSLMSCGSTYAVAPICWARKEASV